MRIQHNIMAMNAYRNYNNNVSAMQKNLEKLSSGFKINRAGDDAAGLAISEKMRAQITGLETAQKNAKDGISLVQTAEGALTEVHDMLNRMVELATQSANGTYDNENDRLQLQKEVDQLREEIDRIADSANFNGIKLLDGSMSDNTVTPITVATGGFTAEGSKTYTYASAAGVFGTVPATDDGTNPTILHSSGAAATPGKFTIALDHLTVGKPANAASTATVNIIIAGSTAVVKDTGANGTMDGKKIATQLVAGDGKYVIVKKGGAVTLASSTAAAKAAATSGGLVYLGATNGDGTVTYTLKYYGATTNTWHAASTATSLGNGTPDIDATAANKDLNFTVAASEVKGALSTNAPNRGTIDAQNTQLKEDPGLGNANITLTAANLKDGMKITIGADTRTGAAATNIKTIILKTKSSGSYADIAAAKGSADELDLTAYASSGGTITDATGAIRAIANKLNSYSATTGIVVGYNASRITLSELTTGSGASSAPSAVTKAMEKVETFGTLLKAENVTENAETPGNVSSVITVDPSQLFEGNSIKLTVGTASDATKTYVFTKDATKLTGAAPSGTVYVDLNSTDVVGKLMEKVEDAVEAAYTVDPAGSVRGVDVARGSGSNANKITVTITGMKAAIGTTNTKKHPMANITATTANVWTGNSGLTLQIGDTADDFNQLNLTIKDMHVKAMGIDLDNMSIATQSDAKAAIDKIKAAVNYVSDVRGDLGATQNRLDHTINNLSVMQENIQDAESTIRDTDIAAEMMAYTKNNILIQSAQAMLAQANQVPQGVLQLLQ